MPSFFTGRLANLSSLTFSRNRRLSFSDGDLSGGHHHRRGVDRPRLRPPLHARLAPWPFSPVTPNVNIPIHTDNRLTSTIVDDMASYVNKQVRLLKHDYSNVREDHLDKRWEAATGEIVDEIIFLSRHTAASKRPALTIHPIGVPHLREDEVPPAGGKPGWAAPPNPRMGPWLRLLNFVAQSHNLTPEFEVTLEATHHGPLTNSPTMFVEIGSTEEYWKRQDAAQAIALLVWKGLGLDGGIPVGDWQRNNGKNKILLGIGGGHYVPKHMGVVMKDDVWVGHLLSGYSLPMEDNGESGVGGTWREAIKVAYDATEAAFPGGEILAHLDQKSFKGWQKNAILGFLKERNIKVGKPQDFH